MSVNRTHIEAHQDAAGKTNWLKFQEARKANGEVCITCGAGILQPVGRPARCTSCIDFERRQGAVVHQRFAHCPQCGGRIDPKIDELVSVLQEGTNHATCEECNCVFEVVTHVSYTFTSPPRK